jgi:DNA-binding winged helix-turn-helix (wHTH) protein
MPDPRLRFGPFELDRADRRLTRGGQTVELNARYFDALALLVREEGRLVSKDRFMSEVWRGVPVTDEALTQCVRTLRRQLGDDASAPRFIETVPKHGYRFVAAVEPVQALRSPFVSSEVETHIASGEESVSRLRSKRTDVGVEPLPQWRRILTQGGIGTAGAAAAGLVGGLAYGLVTTAQPAQGAGGSSVLLVLLSLTLLAALVGGAGVSFGMAVARGPRSSAWMIAGAATGGLLAGGIAKLLGLDAFDLLLGRSPGAITGAAEGAVLGASVGLAVWLASRSARPFALRRSIASAALVGAAGGLIVTLIGGRLMGGSLDLLARAFPTTRVRVDHVGAWLGEDGFGPLSHAVTSALEGAVFTAGIVAALALAKRSKSATTLDNC